MANPTSYTETAPNPTAYTETAPTPTAWSNPVDLYGYLLQEDDSYLLQENGDKLYLTRQP